MKIGDIVVAKVTGIQPYGAFVSLDEDTTGLIHISEISDGFVRDVHQFVRVGEEVRVKVIDIDEQHHQVRLSLKAVNSNRRNRSRQNVGRPLKPSL